MRSRAGTTRSGGTNRAIVEEMFRSVDRCAWDELRRFFADDIVYERPGYARLVGLDQLVHFYREIRVIASGVHRLHQIVVEGARVACCGHFSGRRKDGVSVEVGFADTYTIENHKIRRRFTYFFVPAV